MRQAGWSVKDRKLVNAKGEPFAFEILLNGPSSSASRLPYVQSSNGSGWSHASARSTRRNTRCGSTRSTTT